MRSTNICKPHQCNIMKIIPSFYVIMSLLIGAIATPELQAQNNDLPYIRPNSKAGINVFENPKSDTAGFDGIRVRVGGDFSVQFQGLSQTDSGDTLAELGGDFNLPSMVLRF